MSLDGCAGLASLRTAGGSSLRRLSIGAYDGLDGLVYGDGAGLMALALPAMGATLARLGYRCATLTDVGLGRCAGLRVLGYDKVGRTALPRGTTAVASLAYGRGNLGALSVDSCVGLACLSYSCGRLAGVLIPRDLGRVLRVSYSCGCVVVPGFPRNRGVGVSCVCRGSGIVGCRLTDDCGASRAVSFSS